MEKIRNIFGDKNFYKAVFLIAVPVMIQNGITNFVGLLDNIMVGQIGTAQMSGVAIVNQLIFVYNICIFGGLAGAGIFTAQFYGSADYKGVRDTFRFKLIIGAVLCVAAFIIFGFFSEPLISLYINNDGPGGDAAAVMQYAKQYIKVMMLEIIPFALAQIYTSTLRETNDAALPMKAGIVAVIVNFVLNWLLIFGNLGFPCMGVMGAALATAVARIVELLVIMVNVHKRKDEFIKGVYRTLRIPKSLCVNMIKKGTPLLMNEILWSGGMAVMMQCYSVRGLDVVAALNISSTITNLFNIVFMSFGSATAIMVGQQLGAEEFDRAKKTAFRLLFFTTSVCAAVGLVLSGVSGYIPQIYNTTDTVKKIASELIIDSAILMPCVAFCNCCYFAIRSGGKTIITMLFDCVFVWCVNIPLAFCISRYTDIDIKWVYLMCQGAEIIKCFIGFFMLKSNWWINTLKNEV